GAARWTNQVSAAMDRANQDLYDDLTEVSKFITAFAGFYNPEHRTVSFVNAGHSPVLYKASGEPTVLLQADDPPLGVVAGTFATGRRLRMESGDILVVASDGLSEARGLTGELYGNQRLCKLVDRNSTASADTIAAALFAEIEAFSAGH